MLVEWVLEKLESVEDEPYIVLRDPLQLLSPTDDGLKTFAENNDYITIVAATNLVFRELLKEAQSDPQKHKVLLIDRTPLGRQRHEQGRHAPPIFYPDLLDEVPKSAYITLDLQEFLKDQTNGDPTWPKEVNNRQYARLIAQNLEGVLDAYKNLRHADSSRFTDEDLRKIVAFASLGNGKSAFKSLNSGDYWKFGLLKHEELKELSSLTPDVIKTVKQSLTNAPKPFCWFAQHDPDVVIRGFYLSLIISQHSDNWPLILQGIAPDVRFFGELSAEELKNIAPSLIKESPQRANADLDDAENYLDKEALSLLLIDQLHIDEPQGFVSVIQQEEYSTLVRSLTLLLAIRDLMSPEPSFDYQKQLYEFLFSDQIEKPQVFVDERTSRAWTLLKDAYKNVYELLQIRKNLRTVDRLVKVKSTDDLNFIAFWKFWNEKHINRLEYSLSAVERILFSADDLLLPRRKERLPKQFIEILEFVRKRIPEIKEKEEKLINDLNIRFQEVVKRDYPSWTEGSEEVVLTSQFISRLLKPHWDPQTENAVIFIFDGMRYDIWDEFLRPQLLEFMEVVEELRGCSLIPSETKISRNAISAGAFPDSFKPNDAENSLLEASVAREFAFSPSIEKVDPTDLGIGQTVRYSADSGNLEMYIFEFCDKGLHNIRMKEVDGKMVPARPLADIYEEFRRFIERDVMAVMRNLAPGTKVFVTADHGFGPIGRDEIWFKEDDLSDPGDCHYLHCALPQSLSQTHLPQHIQLNIIEFSPKMLRLPVEERYIERRTRNEVVKKRESIVFPKVGYAFSRPGTYFKPDAYSHGGISLQELIVPMAVLKVKSTEREPISVEFITAPSEIYEGEEITFRVQFRHSGNSSFAGDDLRIDLDARESDNPDTTPLRPRVIFLPTWSQHTVDFRFTPTTSEIDDEERNRGSVDRLFTLTYSYHDGRKKVRNMLTHKFVVNLNSGRIVRRVGSLGNILGLTPKGTQRTMEFR